MIVYLAALFGLMIYLWKIKTSKPSKFPPGPPRYPIIGSVPFITPPNQSPNIFWGVCQLQKQYGNIFGMYIGGLRAVVFTKYDDIKEVFNMDDFAGRPSFAPAHRFRKGWETVENVEPEVNTNRPPGVLFSQGKFWREQRRFLLRHLRDFGFGKNSMEESLQDEVLNLIDFLEPNVDKPFDMNRVTNISILNALWFIMTGEKMKLDDPKLGDIVKSFDNVTRRVGGGPSGVIANILPNPNWIMLPGLKQISGVQYVEETMNAVSNYIIPILKEHQQTHDENFNRDFLDVMISENKCTTDSTSSFYGKTGESAIISDFMELFLAGMETTSSSLMWAFLYLLHHPDIQAKIHEEIIEVVGQDRLPSLEDRKNMHYTEAFLLESFRYTSFVPMAVFHSTMKDVQYKGYYIPKDTAVISSLYHVMHDPVHFKNPGVFQPERFLNQDGEFVHDDHVVPFGIGKRFCLGRTLAEKEFFLFFTGFIQKYKLENVPGIKPPSYSIEDIHVAGILRGVPPYELILRKRI